MIKLFKWIGLHLTTILGDDNVKAKAEPMGSISARVFRAETGEYEDLGIISKGKVSKGIIQPEGK
jgi:hypothetical protein